MSLRKAIDKLVDTVERPATEEAFGWTEEDQVAARAEVDRLLGILEGVPLQILAWQAAQEKLDNVVAYNGGGDPPEGDVLSACDVLDTAANALADSMLALGCTRAP